MQENQRTKLNRLRQRQALNTVAAVLFIVSATIWIPKTFWIGCVMIVCAGCYGMLALKDHRLLGEIEPKMNTDILKPGESVFIKPD